MRPPLWKAGLTQTTRPLISAATSICARGRTVPAPWTGRAPAPATTGSVTAKGTREGGSRRASSGRRETMNAANAPDPTTMPAAAT